MLSSPFSPEASPRDAFALAADLLDPPISTGEGPVWREDPVDFDTFVRSPVHLGLGPLYPLQSEPLHLLIGPDPKQTFADPLKAPEEFRRQFQTACLLFGKGSGKDYMCSIVVCYLVYILLCLSDPQAYLQLAPDEPIDIINVAYNADQAKQVFFAKLKARVKRWPWLHQRCNMLEGGRRQGQWVLGRSEVVINDDNIVFPGSIRAWSRHAQNESYEGLNVLVWIMDEASAFLSKLKRENAEAIYQTLKTSAASRFGLRWLGFIISFPRHGDDFTMTKLKEARLRPELGMLAVGPCKTWEVNLRTKDEPRILVRDLEVPASLANDFEADFEESLSRYCCEPPMAREAFFRFPQHLRDAVQAGRPPLIEWEPCLIERTDGENGETRSYVGVKLTHLRRLADGAKLYGHGDPGLVNDSFALAIAHAVPATIVRHLPAAEVLEPDRLALFVRTGREPEEMVDWEVDVTRTIVDALIIWRPSPRYGFQVDLQNVEDVIFQLKGAYPSLGHFPKKTRGESERRPTFTFDQWNSALTIQRMKSRRMNVKDESWSRDMQVGLYRNARTNFYNGLVTLPDTPSITSQDPGDPGAIYELERIEFIDAVKVDHPQQGSKDCGDAIVRVIQHATEHNRSAFAYGGMFGHRSLYKATAPFLPAPGEPADPEHPAGIPEHLKEREERVRTERPLGELEPSTGRIAGEPRRLAFGSIGATPPAR